MVPTLDTLLTGKLSNVLTNEQRDRKIGNLLTKLRRQKPVLNEIPRREAMGDMAGSSNHSPRPFCLSLMIGDRKSPTMISGAIS